MSDFAPDRNIGVAEQKPCAVGDPGVELGRCLGRRVDHDRRMKRPRPGKIVQSQNPRCRRSDREPVRRSEMVAIDDQGSNAEPIDQTGRPRRIGFACRDRITLVNADARGAVAIAKGGWGADRRQMAGVTQSADSLRDRQAAHNVTMADRRPTVGTNQECGHVSGDCRKMQRNVGPAVRGRTAGWFPRGLGRIRRCR